MSGQGDKFQYFGGIEGGASNTKFLLVRSDGQVMSSCDGGGTNTYLIGIDKCLKRIADLVNKGLDKAVLPRGTTLEGLGMSISGGDEKSTQEKIMDIMKQEYSTLTRHTFVGSDTQSALATALPQGGIVLIAGTGSNCQLINSDGSMARSGGWGHMIGDEGSACWIALRAVKILFDHEDNFVPCDLSVNALKEAIFTYFKMKARGDILDHMYANFDKSKFSNLCRELSKVAQETGDDLCRRIFKDAGRVLAQHLCAVAGKINSDLKTRSGGVPIVCMGSVFKSWKLLEPGFVEVMQARKSETGINELTLLSLTKDATIGAVALGARAARASLALDFSDNADVLFTTKF